MSKLVSVIIPTTDREKNILFKCVEAVKRSSYGPIEIIVVNDGKERSAQRNIGIDRAKGEYLLILDSDQIITRNLIKECVSIIDCCSGIYIPEIITTDGFFGYLRNWERKFYTGTAVDVVRFVHKGCPKFDETMSGPEDSDWDRRIGGKRLTSESVLFHQDKIGFIDYLKKKAYYSKSMGRFKEKHPKDKVLNFWWRCFGVYFESGKWKMVVQRPDLFLCLMGLILIRGAIYLCLRKS